MPKTAAMLFDKYVENFGDPICRVKVNSKKTPEDVDLFWAPCSSWNEALLRNWLNFPVNYTGPMMGDQIPYGEKMPHEGGFLVMLPVGT